MEITNSIDGSEPTPKLVNITSVLGENTIRLYGFIGPYEKVDWQPFQDAFRPMDKPGNEVEILINGNGGETFTGLSIFDLVKNAKATVSIINEGVAASMSGVLTQAASKGKRFVTKNSRIMIHRVRGGCNGDADDHTECAKLITDEEDKIVAIYMESTGKDEKTVRGWFKRGVNKWFSAKEAIANCLADEIIESNSSSNEFKDSDFKNKSPEEVWAMYNHIDTNNQISDMNKFKMAILAILAQNGITAPAENESEEKWVEALNNAFISIKGKVDAANNQLATLNKSRATELIENAESKGLLANLDATKKEALVNNAISNYDGTKMMLDSIPGNSEGKEIPAGESFNINAALGRTEGQGAKNIPEDRKNWGLTEWSKNDYDGLQAMEKKNPGFIQGLMNKVEDKLLDEGFKKQQ